VVPIVLLALAGLFVGGAISMHRQGASQVAVAVVGFLAVVAGAAGVAWLLPAL
jgi:hypothetical protein